MSSRISSSYHALVAGRRDAGQTPADTAGWSLRDVVQLAGTGMARLTEGLATNTIARGDIAAIERLTVLLIHEGYTLGQIAELRRLMGLEGAIGRQPAT